MSEVTLPCGYLDPEAPETLHKTVDLREMTGYEEDILTDRQKTKSAEALEEILSRCIQRIGPFERPAGREAARDAFFRPHLKNMRSADITFLVIRLRQLSLGDKFIFAMPCPHCQEDHPRLVVDLSTLEVTEAQDGTKMTTTVTLSDGKEAVMRAPLGRDLEAMRKLLKGKRTDAVSASIFTLIDSLGGEKVQNLVALKKLLSRDRALLRAAVNGLEGGIDTTIELECDGCGSPWQTTLPVDKATFFFPSETPP